MTKFQLLFIALSFSFFCQAQTKKAPPSSTLENTLNLHFLMPGLSYQKPVTQSSLLEFGVWVAPGTSTGNVPDGGTALGVLGVFDVSYKWLFNQKKRADKGKYMGGNTGWYFGGQAIYSMWGFPKLNSFDLGGGVGPLVGFQRSWANNFRLDIGMGAGLGISSASVHYETPLTWWPLGKASLSYTLKRW